MSQRVAVHGAIPTALPRSLDAPWSVEVAPISIRPVGVGRAVSRRSLPRAWYRRLVFATASGGPWNSIPFGHFPTPSSPNRRPRWHQCYDRAQLPSIFARAIAPPSTTCSEPCAQARPRSLSRFGLASSLRGTRAVQCRSHRLWNRRGCSRMLQRPPPTRTRSCQGRSGPRPALGEGTKAGAEDPRRTCPYRCRSGLTSPPVGPTPSPRHTCPCREAAAWATHAPRPPPPLGSCRP